MMAFALEEAEQALAIDEVPIGCIIARGPHILGRGHNLRETTKDPTAHAEMIAIRDAAATLDAWRLLDTTLYVTLEPCMQCMGAAILARIPRIVFGCADPKAGVAGSVLSLQAVPPLNHAVEVTGGVREAECSQLLTDFFKKLRAAPQS
jgi:tRNA(adenine34) deaminase